jgi:ABC-type sugar transport system substrate-binding protein
MNPYRQNNLFQSKGEANDPIVLGTIGTIIESGKKPGRDIFIGGLNRDKPALEKIKDGMLTISMGGHFMTGGWTMVLQFGDRNRDAIDFT